MSVITQELNDHYLIAQQEKEMCEKSLYGFFVKAWNVLEPHTPLQNNWHLGLMAEYLTAVHEREIKKLVINIPPRNVKSRFCTVSFPSWVWTLEAHHKFITWSYAERLSTIHSYDRRRLIESEWYQSHWGDTVQIASDQNQKTFYENTQTGFMFSTSTGGSMTGQGCDTQIIDDPQNPKEAESEAKRDAPVDFWKGTASSRFNNPKKKAVVCVMQRLHEKDLTAYFRDKDKDWEFLVIPSQAPEEVIYTFPKTGKIKIFEKDEILHPEREGQEELDQALIDLGSYGYAAQRMQNPTPRKGGLVERRWFKRFDEPPESYDKLTHSMDCTFKGLDNSDFVVLETWLQKGADHYLIDLVRKQLSFPETLKLARLWCKKYPNYHEFLIEDKANGPAVIASVQGELDSVIAINPGSDSKISRFASISPMVEAGNIWIPNELYTSWVDPFLVEVCAFPKAPNDDQADAMSQYLNRVKVNRTGTMSEDLNKNTGSTMVGGINSTTQW